MTTQPSSLRVKALTNLFTDELNDICGRDKFHDVWTPIELANLICDGISQYTDWHGEICVFHCCSLFRAVVKRVSDLYGMQHALENVTFVASFMEKIEYCQKMVEQNGQILKYKYIPYERLVRTLKEQQLSAKELREINAKKEFNDMEFDVILGNSPFQPPNQQEGKRGSKGSTEKLWPLFAKLALDIVKPNGIISLIHPLSWLSGTRDIAKGSVHLLELISAKQFIFLDTTIKRYFTEGSTFGYYIVKNTESNGAKTEVKTQEGTQFIDFSTVLFLPSSLNTVAISINNKTLFNSGEKYYFKSIHPAKFENRYEEKSEEHPWKIYACGKNGKTQLEKEKPDNYVYYVDVKHQLHDKRKIIINKSVGDTFQAYVDDGQCGLAVNSMVYTINNNEDFSLEGANSFWNSKLVRFLFQYNRFSGWINYKVIRQIPKVDLSKVWTDQELYDHFVLTQEEINLIEQST